MKCARVERSKVDWRYLRRLSAVCSVVLLMVGCATDPSDSTEATVVEPTPDGDAGGVTPSDSADEDSQVEGAGPDGGEVGADAVPQSDGSGTAEGDTAVDAIESDGCEGSACGPLECGPLGSEVDGTCDCVAGACFDGASNTCVERWFEDDFSVLEDRCPILVPVRTDLLARYANVGQLRLHVQGVLASVIDVLEPEEDAWEEYGHALLATPLCSLFQLGVSEWPTGYFEEMLSTLAGKVSGETYVPLLLTAIVSDKVDVCLLHHVLDAVRQDVVDELEVVPEPHLDLVRGALARYLITLDFFDETGDTELIQTAKTLLYPDGAFECHGVWDSALVFDLVHAYYFQLNYDEAAVLLALDASWQEFGGVELVDCEGDHCAIKGIHQVVLIDSFLGIVPEDKLVQIASLLVSNIWSDGTLGFPAVLGLPPDILWEESYCDVFCSAKHWHIGMCLNHLLAKLEHREADIKAGAALLDLGQGPDGSVDGIDGSGLACVFGLPPECPDGEYCRVGGCGIGLAGVCVSKPEECEPEGGPVCGCDGNTYANTCYATKAGQRAIGPGPCPATSWDCEVDTSGWGFGAGCAGDEYCYGGCEGYGFCREIPLCGNEPFDIQCSCNGLDYATPCVLASAGKNLASAGSCGVEQSVTPAELCGGPDGFPCEDPEKLCNLISCQEGTDGYCVTVGEPGDQEGWTADGFVCISGSLECGCDGVTYSSQCDRIVAGVAFSYPGECDPTGEN